MDENVINETVSVIEKLVNKIVELKAQNAQLMETNRNLKNQNTESAGNLADILAKAQEVLKD
jgi:cell shape-determining protein MreC